MSTPDASPLTRAAALFAATFDGAQPALLARAPGRVNLIGEHTDYNDGFVLPIAIDREIAIAARPATGARSRLHSANYGDAGEFDPATVAPGAPLAGPDWLRYPAGVAWALRDAGQPAPAIDGAIAGDVPLGAGMSSSAAVEVATALTLLAAAGAEMPGPELALLCQRAENRYVGVQCGIMDQFISRLGARDHALLVDCRSLDYQLVPLRLGEARLLVCNTNVQRGLVDSEYNQRRAECGQAVAALAQRLPGVRALRDVTPEQLARHEADLPPLVYRRARHVVGENARTLAAVEALTSGDLTTLGQHLNASHDSLRDDYQVSCRELDALVDICRADPATYGARMTGGGFGGCMIALVAAEALERVEAAITREYPARTGLQPTLYRVTAVDGASVTRA
ncbi:MAG: galactokinase [Chloroflexi bacterium]|nr:galactokinase [Chloroflexota bacterium]